MGDDIITDAQIDAFIDAMDKASGGQFEIYSRDAVEKSLEAAEQAAWTENTPTRGFGTRLFSFTDGYARLSFVAHRDCGIDGETDELCLSDLKGNEISSGAFVATHSRALSELRG